MDQITKTARQQKAIINLIDEQFDQYDGDNVKVTKLIRNKMLEQDLYTDNNWTFAKQYISEKALSQSSITGKAIKQ